MRKIRVAISGTLCIFATACVMNLTPSTPSASSSLSSEFSPSSAPSNQAQQNSPVPTDSTQPNLVVNVSPTPIVSSSPLISPTFTPSPAPTWPPDVVAKNLSFVDWPEYPGVQFFRGMGKGIYLAEHESSRAHVGSLEVERKTGNLLVQLGWLSVVKSEYKFPREIPPNPNCQGCFPSTVSAVKGWAEMIFDASNGNEQWKFGTAGDLGKARIDNFAPQEFFPKWQETVTQNHNGYNSIVLLNENNYNPNTKLLTLSPEFVSRPSDSVNISFADTNNLLFSEEQLNQQLLQLSYYLYYGIWQQQSKGIFPNDYFTRSLTLGKRALYGVFPNYQKRTLTIYAFLLPNLDRVVEFDLPFIRPEALYTTSNGINYPMHLRDIIVLRYHEATQKLYLFVENQGSIIKAIDHFVEFGINNAQLFRFSEEYVLQ